MGLELLKRRTEWVPLTAAGAITLVTVLILALCNCKDSTVISGLQPWEDNFMYIVTCLIHGIFISILSELVRRVCLFFEEMKHLQQRYEGKYRKVLRAAFGFENGRAVFLFVIWIAVIVLTYATCQNPPPLISMLATKWTFCIVLSVSPISYMFGLRTPTKAELSDSLERNRTNVGHGLAWSYYYGYLRLILPNFEDRMLDWKRDTAPGARVSPKLYILLPKSCLCGAALTEMDHSLTQAGHPESFYASRAGCVQRQYKNTVYQVSKGQTVQDEYYCVAEFATPLHSLYEMCDGKEAGLSQEEKVEQMRLFHATLDGILKMSPTIGGSCRLVAYDDRLDDGSQQKISEVLKKFIDNDLREEALKRYKSM